MRPLATVSLALLGFPPLAEAISSGLVTECNAKAVFGCPRDKWTNNDRSRCSQPGIMPWAGEPFHSANYTLRAGDGERAADRTTYAPGVPMSLDLRVHHPEMKWRGIIMHAVDSQGNTVGDWEIPEGDLPLFQVPPACPGVLAHTDAKDKPFHVGRAHFMWVPPAKGTGTVTFHTVLKEGPANIGEFYYPETDLVLYEQGNENAPVFNPDPNATKTSINHVSSTSLGAEWFLAGFGQTCDELCEAMDKECDMDAMRHSTSKEFVSQIESTYRCPAVAIRDCSFASPAVAADGQCYFHSALCSAQETQYANAGGGAAEAVEDEATVCSAATTGQTSRHFCVCSSALARLAASPLTALLALMTTLHLVAGAAPSARPAGTAPLAAAGLGAALLLGVGPAPASAHNWAMSRTRSTQIARAGRVCDARKSGEVHAQVGPGQHFTLQWATGHSRHSYVVVTLGSEEHMQTNRSYLSMVQQYLDEAPAGSNKIPLGPQYHRKHLSGGSLLSVGTNGDGQENPYDTEETDMSAPVWQEVHPDTKDNYKTLTTYKQDIIDSDMHVSYHNEKFPWIEAAHRYDQVYSRGGDLDLARVEIPGRSCPPGSVSCHYVVHWYWSGYSDCVDVDYFPNQQVENIYGVPSADGVQYIKVDHCQYLEPQKGLSQCHLITDNDATPCMDELHQSSYFKGAFRGVPTGSDTWRFGVSAVPAVPPPDIPAPLRSAAAVPWHKGWCAGEATRLEGQLDRPKFDWSAWQERKAEHKVNYECAEVLWEKNMTFAEAVEMCAVDHLDFCARSSTTLRRECFKNREYMPKVCYGISFPAALATPDLNAEYLFRGCAASSSPLVADASRQVWSKRNAAAMSSASGAGPWVRISFQKPEDPMVRQDGATAAGWLKEDLSAEFGARDSGLKYGFNCLKGAPGTSNLYARDGVDNSINQLKDANNQPLTGHFLGWQRSVDSTYVDFRRNSKCLDQETGLKTDRVWEVEVSNGIYEVRTNHEVGNDRMAQYSNFVVENVRLPISDFSGRGDYGHDAIVGHRDIRLPAVEVLDGRLTVRVDERSASNHGTSLNWIQFRRVGDPGTLTPAWLPSSANPGLRFSLAQSEPVGLVKITLPGPANHGGVNLPCRRADGNCPRLGPDLPNLRDCRAGWFFRGDACGHAGPLAPQAVPMPGGRFDRSDEGAIVSVSDDFMFTYREAEVCARITVPPLCLSALLANNEEYTVDRNGKLTDNYLATLCPIEVNCQGRRGRYVHIVLPGAKRILSLANVDVHRSKPVIPAGIENPMVCYGVEARQASALPFPVAEFETTNDPEDPIFYSSCFVRTEVIEWLPTTAVPSSKAPDYVFNGKCLDCDSYKQVVEQSNSSKLEVPLWLLDDQCGDCHVAAEVGFSEPAALASVTQGLGQLKAVPAENPEGIRGGGSSAAVAVVLVVLLLAAAGGACYYKRDKIRARLPSATGSSTARPAETTAGYSV